MAVVVSLREFRLIEKLKQKGKRKGLLAALSVWDDFKGLDKVITHIYKNRADAKDRKIKGTL